MTIKLTREEAIKVLSSYDVNGDWADVDGKPYNAEEQAEAFDMAIEALEGVCFDEWCTDCKEYDTEKKCCPRFNRVIREAMKRIPHEDGTLEVKVEDATKIGRVLISDDKHRGGLYYPDEDEPQGDLISRADAIEALGEEPPVWYDGEDEIAERDQWRADIEAIKSVPSADRPRGEWIAEEEYGDLWTCDQCGFANEHNDNFCPNCGADMRSE